MRTFEFQLRLPGGSVVTAKVTTESWQWHDAFSAACARVEAELGIPANSGVICVDYRSTPDPMSASAA